MITAAIITEYNPFHNGHAYQIKKLRELTRADYIIVVMSGNFVQRGAPAIMDKYLRTKMALSSGIDYVFELPVLFATASSEDFARAGIKLITSLGCVDYLCFGSEEGSLSSLQKVSRLLNDETSEFSSLLKQELAKGKSFPKARDFALSSVCSCSSNIWSEPNNLLGIEYLKAIEYFHSNLKPITIKRIGNFHSSNTQNTLASASALRNILSSSNLNEKSKHILEEQIPRDALPYLTENFWQCFPLDWENFYDLLCGQILIHKDHLNDFSDVSEDLAKRLLHIFWKSTSVHELTKNLKTRQYTYTRIQRCLLHILLGITKEFINTYKTSGYLPYARILGFKRENSDFLKEITATASLPIITKMSTAKEQLTPEGKQLLELEIFSSSLYEIGIKNKFKQINRKNEFNHGLIIF